MTAVMTLFVARAVHGQTRMWNLAKEVAMTRLVERFMERVKRLDFELSR